PRRSVQCLIGFVADVPSLVFDLFLHKQGADTTPPSGRALFKMMGVFAEFERAMIQERVRAGFVRAGDEGKQLGRPPIPGALEERIREARRGGLPVRKAAAKFGVSPGTVLRIPFAPEPKGRHRGSTAQ